MLASGLEPPCFYAFGFEPNVSTNSTKQAKNYKGSKYISCVLLVLTIYLRLSQAPFVPHNTLLRQHSLRGGLTESFVLPNPRISPSRATPYPRVPQTLQLTIFLIYCTASHRIIGQGRLELPTLRLSSAYSTN